MLTHRSKKPYECSVDNCGKSYCDIRSLRRHFESQHPGLTMEDHMNYTGDEKDPKLMAAEVAAQASHQAQQALVAGGGVNSNPGQYMMTNMSGGTNSGTMNQMLQTPPNPSPSPEGSSSSSAALQFLAQAALRAQGAGHLSPPPNSQSPNGQGNSQIPVPQDVPGLFPMETYSNNQNFAAGLPPGTTTSQSVATSGTPPVFKFQQNSISNPLLRPMSARDAMLGTSERGGKGHHKGHDKEKEWTPVECSVCKRTFKSMTALNGHMRLHGGYNNTRSELEHQRHKSKHNQQQQQEQPPPPSQHQQQQLLSSSRHQTQPSSVSPVQNTNLNPAPPLPLTLQRGSGPPLPIVSAGTAPQGPRMSGFNELPPVSISIPSVPLSLPPNSQMMHASPPQRPLVKQEPLTQLPDAPGLPNFPGFMFPPPSQTSQPQMLIPQSQYFSTPVYQQPPMAPQPMYIGQINRVRTGTPPRPPSSGSPMPLPRLVPSLEQQGAAAAAAAGMPQQSRQVRIGSPGGGHFEHELSPPKLEAMRPAKELYEQPMNQLNQPRIFIDPSHVMEGRYDGIQREMDDRGDGIYVPRMDLDRIPSKQALTSVKLENQNGSGVVIGVGTAVSAGNDSDVFRPPPVHTTLPKKKPRARPTLSPGRITPSQMRSPREMGGFYHRSDHRSGTTPPPYTPPPMLSPIRSGSGLYFNVGASLSSGGITPKTHLPMASPSLISMHRRSTGGKRTNSAVDGHYDDVINKKAKKVTDHSPDERDSGRIVEYHEYLGGGACGEVHRVTWMNTNHQTIKAAAKKVRITEDNSNENILREADMLKKLNHVNVIRFFGLETTESHVIIVTEYAAKGSLRGILKRDRQLAKRRFDKWMLEAALGIQYAHHRDIVHYDVKSENFVVSGEDILKLCDLGIARHLTQTTMTSKEAGTEFWLAPEVFKYQLRSPACDVYSYGVVVWELYTCENPGKGFNVRGAYKYQVGVNNYRPPIPDDCQASVRNLIERCWLEDHKQRPSMDKVVRYIQEGHSDVEELC